MDIYNFFSCYTNLPVRLQDVIDQVMAAEVVDEIEIYALNLDPAILRGFCWVFKDKPKNSINHRRVAWIGYSNKLTSEMARLTIVKELLHLLDDHFATAGTAAQVSRLVDEIVLPIAAHIAVPTLQDHNGELKALTVLMPACAIEELRHPLAAETISLTTIARHARLPVEHVRLAFSDLWQKILTTFGVEPVEGATKSTAPEPEFPFEVPSASATKDE